MGKPTLGILEGVWPDHSLADILSAFHNSVSEDFVVSPFPGIGETLRMLASRYLLGVVSSAPRKHLDKVFNRFPEIIPRNLFGFVLCAEDSPVHKPDPKVFDGAFKYLEGFHMNENHGIYVGDNLGDYRAASARGMSFVAVTTGFCSEGDFVEAGLDRKFILQSFNQLPNFLEEYPSDISF